MDNWVGYDGTEKSGLELLTFLEILRPFAARLGKSAAHLAVSLGHLESDAARSARYQCNLSAEIKQLVRLHSRSFPCSCSPRRLTIRRLASAPTGPRPIGRVGGDAFESEIAEALAHIQLELASLTGAACGQNCEHHRPTRRN